MFRAVREFERLTGYATGGVYVRTRAHIPNILKDKGNRKKEKYGEQSVKLIDCETLSGASAGERVAPQQAKALASAGVAEQAYIVEMQDRVEMRGGKGC